MQKEKGISEVVGTILLVSIGIVLVVVLSMYLTGMFSSITSGSDNAQPLSVNTIPNIQNNQITFLVSSGSVPSMFSVNLLSPAGQNIIANPSVSLTGASTVTVSGQGVSIKIMDVNHDGKLDAGDVLILQSINQNLINLNGYVLQIVYDNDVVFSYTIQV
ncbi:MAG: archaellin/type IV pilin N-terminal domain-containing protein [Thermoplasmata archaeon]